MSIHRQIDHLELIIRTIFDRLKIKILFIVLCTDTLYSRFLIQIIEWNTIYYFMHSTIKYIVKNHILFFL